MPICSADLADHHPAFAGDDVLRHVKTETAEIPERARLSAPPLSLDRVRAVLDDDQAVLSAPSAPMRSMSHGLPAKCTGTMARVLIGNALFEQVDTSMLYVIGVDVDDHGRCAGMDDGIRCGAKRHGRGDDLVARLQIRGDHAHVQRRRAGIYCGGLVGRHRLVCGELLFELGDARSRADPSRFQRRDHFVDFVGANVGRSKDDEGRILISCHG